MEISYEDLKRELNIKVLGLSYRDAISLNAKDMRMLETEDKYVFAFLTYEDKIESIEILKEDIDNLEDKKYLYKHILEGEDCIGLLIDHNCWDYLEDTINNEEDYNDKDIFTYNNDIIVDIKDIAMKTGKNNIVCGSWLYLAEDNEDINILDIYFDKKEIFNTQLRLHDFKIPSLDTDKFIKICEILNKYNCLDNLEMEKEKMSENFTQKLLSSKFLNIVNNIEISTTLDNVTKEEYLVLKDILSPYIKDGGYFSLEYCINIKDIPDDIKGKEYIFDGRE